MGLSVSGLGSGIDWKSMVSQLSQVETQQFVNPLKTQKTGYQDKLTAWQTLGSKLSALQTAIAGLKDSGDFDVFKTSLASDNTAVSASSIFSATAGTGASQGSYDMRVTALAKGDKLRSNTFADTTSAAGVAGTMAINGQNVDLTADMTLTDVRNAINEKTGSTNVTASIVKYAENDYRLYLGSQKTGTVSGTDKGGTIDLTGSTANLTFSQQSGSYTDAQVTSSASGGSGAGVAGDLTINGMAFTLTADMGLNDIMSAINAQTGSTNVVAAIADMGTNDHRLYLTNKSGTGAVDLTGSTVSMGFSDRLQTAQDASIVIDGNTMTSRSNTVTDILPGVTLNLLSDKNSSTTVSLNVSRDNEAITKKVQAVVDAYNDIADFMNTQSSYDQTNKKAGGPLFGDGMLKTIKNNLQNTFLTQFTMGDGSTKSALSSLGVTFDTSGKLSFDSSKLDTAVSTDTSDTFSLLNQFGQAMDTALDSFTDSISGTVALREKSIQSIMDRLGTKITSTQDRIDRKMEALASVYQKMDSAVGTMQSQLSYLSSALGSMWSSSK